MSQNVKTSYSIAASTLACTLASLASDTNLLAGRAAAAYDNTTNLATDVLLDGTVMTGTTPTVSTTIEVWVVGVRADGTWPDVFLGSDGNKTITSSNIKNVICRQAAQIVVTATSNQAYPWGPISVAALFNGTLPAKFQVFIVHNTVAALNATGGNHVINVQPTFLTVG